MANAHFIPLALAAAAFSTAALAQTDDDASWTGFYAGVQVGQGSQPGDASETIRFDTNLDGVYGDTVRTAAGADAFTPGFCGGAAITALPADGCVGDNKRLEGGAHLGYDYQVGDGFLVGVVADYNRTSLRDSVSSFSSTPARYTMTRELRDAASLRARAGVITGETLIYATGGLAYGKLRNSFSTSNGANSFTGNGNESGFGYALGGGVEQRLAKKFTIGLQYLYRSIAAGDYVVRAGPGTAGLTNPFRIVNANGTDFSRSDSRFASHSIQLTAGYRF